MTIRKIAKVHQRSIRDGTVTLTDVQIHVRNDRAPSNSDDSYTNSFGADFKLRAHRTNGSCLFKVVEYNLCDDGIDVGIIAQRSALRQFLPVMMTISFSWIRVL